MVVIPSGNSMLVKFVQSSNARELILVTPSGILISAASP